MYSIVVKLNSQLISIKYVYFHHKGAEVEQARMKEQQTDRQTD